FGHQIEGRIPTDALELTRALRTCAPQRMHEAVGVMDALGVAGNLGANDAGRVAMIGRTVHPANPIVAQQLNVKRTGRRTIVRTNGMANGNLGWRVHGRPSERRSHPTLTEFAIMAKKCRAASRIGRWLSRACMPRIG